MHNFTSRLFLLILVTAVVEIATAGVLSPQAAWQRSLKSLPTQYIPTTSSPTLIETVKAHSQDALYVFNNGQGQFMVLSTSDATAPVLGYGTMPQDINEIPKNMKEYLEGMAAEISAISRGEGEFATWNENVATIAPMTTAQWDQLSPYNSMCPLIKDKRPYAGCVAVAMSQIMDFYKYPTHGEGQIAYKLTSATDTIHVKADFENTTFMWDSILPVYNKGEYTQGQADAVATLVNCAAVGAKMIFGTKQSATTDYLAGKAFFTYFTYDKSIRPDRKQWYSSDEWNQIVYDELAAGRPVYMAGTGSKGGHAFVCDGYDKDGYFHFNWGWSGKCNGYFLLTALAPDYPQAGDGFNKKVNIIRNIMPDKGTQEVEPLVAMIGNLKTLQNTYKRNATSKITIGDSTAYTFINYGYGMAPNFTFMLKLVSKSDPTDVKDIKVLTMGDFKPNNAAKTMSFLTTLIPVGSWTASLYYTMGDDEEQQFMTDYGASTTLNLDVTEENITVSQSSGIGEMKTNATKITYYDLMGREVSQPRHGIYIKMQNGHAEKVMM